MEEIETKDNRKENEKNIKKEVMEWILCFVIAVIIYLIINYFFGTVSGIKQTSMTPTYVEGEKILIKRNVIFHEELQYGDVITFMAPDESNIDFENTKETLTGNEAIAEYEERKGIGSFIYNFIGIGKKSYIKRVIGLAGDHICILEDGTVTRNGETLKEDYLKDGVTSQNGKFIDVIVPDGTIFVMGDNRLGSLDSRALGCIPVSKIDGYVVAKVWPFSKFEFYK